MTITVDATYENGVLVPAQPLALSEHEKVRVTVEQQQGASLRSGPDSTAPAGEPIWERLAKLAANLPPEEVANWPTDGASQHDHYLYGWPKRPDLTE
ncbi:MAG TPA: antitoxin family protein [Pirellulaceae bacterium]|nr:antitoxin family protein [Pirellulaceae bacterium]